MARSINLGKAHAKTVHQAGIDQDTTMRHAEQSTVTSVIAGAVTGMTDDGEIHAMLDEAADPMLGSRARHEQELAQSSIPALQTLGRAVRSARAEEAGRGRDQDLGFGYEISRGQG